MYMYSEVTFHTTRLSNYCGKPVSLPEVLSLVKKYATDRVACGEEADISSLESLLGKWKEEAEQSMEGKPLEYGQMYIHTYIHMYTCTHTYVHIYVCECIIKQLFYDHIHIIRKCTECVCTKQMFCLLLLYILIL